MRAHCAHDCSRATLFRSVLRGALGLKPGRVMNLLELSQQYQGATLPQLVEKQIKSLNEATLLEAIQGTYENFPAEHRPTIDSYTMNYLKNWFGPHIVTADLGAVFDEAVEDIKAMASENHIPLNDDLVFDVFNLTVMRLSHFAQSRPKFRKQLGI